ncbi:TRAP transporter small permease subunit [Thalassotalea mangrovi]|uniref:TRAP transporter small permease protein n=1 Tax=Thalassotalea mangrovi TaxID=2572245 RepID=A0A4U1B3L6_9GAMM|nr:TRAP transporter small permease subunit [Thalassotalea mangrovi]TKB44626.1 TRAP transporter small permease subunit [Thalassotalea mangrovi]
MFGQWLAKVVTFIDKVNEILGRLIAWLTLVIVLLTFLVVVLRYGFNIGSIALQESVLYAHATIFMLGAAYTLKHNGHVRVDVFYHRCSEKTQAWINLFGTVFLLLPVMIFMAWISSDFISASWNIMEKSREPGGLPFVYLNKSLIYALAFTMSLQGIAEVCRNVLILQGKLDVKHEEMEQV